MKSVHIATENSQQFGNMYNELIASTSLIGPSVGVGSGPAGRGKSYVAQHTATNTNAVYLPPMNQRSPLMLLREITFSLCKVKKGRIESSLEVIGDEMVRERRLIIVDEADLLPISLLEMLRNVNERYSCPILLIGEDELIGKVASRRRISSRIRCRMEFAPMGQADVVLFFKKALDLSISPTLTAMIHRHSKGDWRPVLTVAVSIERAMKASGLNELTEQLVKEIISGNS